MSFGLQPLSLSWLRTVRTQRYATDKGGTPRTQTGTRSVTKITCGRARPSGSQEVRSTQRLDVVKGIARENLECTVTPDDFSGSGATRAKTESSASPVMTMAPCTMGRGARPRRERPMAGRVVIDLGGIAGNVDFDRSAHAVTSLGTCTDRTPAALNRLSSRSASRYSPVSSSRS